jgi:hypothetical protein
MESTGTLKERTSEMGYATPPSPSRQHITPTRWDHNAEQAFGLVSGLGRRLLTEEEWNVHRQVMESLSVMRRDHYRDEVHQQMMDRAKRRGFLTKLS